MPTYDYRCPKCGHQFEVFHSIKDRSPQKCPNCGARARKVPSRGAGLIFKGTGFYITDYRSKDYKDKAKADKAEKPGDTKPSSSVSGAAGGSKKGREKP